MIPCKNSFASFQRTVCANSLNRILAGWPGALGTFVSGAM